MILKGQKRKVPPEDADHLDRTPAELDGLRQLVFYISLNKYKQGQELAEPSLRRSVLIANTLRQMTSEGAVEKTGGLQAPCGPPAVEKAEGPEAPCGAALQSTAMAAAACQLTLTVHHGRPAAATDQFSSPDPQNGVSSSRHQGNVRASVPDACVEGDSEDWDSMSSDPDFSLSAAISSILTSLESSIDAGNHSCTPAAPRTPLRSLENLATPDAEGASKQQGARGPSWGGWERAEESCVEVMRSSYLGDLALDDLFQDIDTSLLERELGVLGSRGEGHPSGEELLKYLPSLSSAAPSPFSFSSSFSSSSSSSSSPFLSLNQNLWCLPSFSSFTPSTSPSSPSFFSFSSPPPPPFPSSSACPGQGLARDGLELDHVMEVLVES